MTDWSKLGRSSRNRGCAFERMVAKKLNVLLGTKFLRTPMSGGHGIDGDVYEDYGARTKWSQLNIYCRTLRSISFESFICDAKHLLHKWVKESSPDAMWIFRSKPGRVFVALPRWMWDHRRPQIRALHLQDHVIFDLNQLPYVNIRWVKPS